MATTKTELALANAELARQLAEAQATIAGLEGRLSNAATHFRAQQKQITDLSIKLCGQIKRGNLLRAKAEQAETNAVFAAAAH